MKFLRQSSLFLATCLTRKILIIIMSDEKLYKKKLSLELSALLVAERNFFKSSELVEH